MALFFFAVIALNPPLLSLFSSDGTLMGLPVLYVYLFSAWAALIGLMAFNAEGGRRARDPGRPRPRRDQG